LAGLLVALLLLAACSEKKVADNSVVGAKDMREPLLRANTFLVSADSLRIVAYNKESKWHLRPTESGLWFEITKQGRGKLAGMGDAVKVKYSTKMLKGPVIYCSDSLGVLSFVLGKGTETRGMEEAIMLLAKGGKARFVQPPFLAYGLVGDGKMIPPRAIVVSEIELVDIVTK
jgi:FKBP-type peptidyl-prolyl cis-trans isomerase